MDDGFTRIRRSHFDPFFKIIDHRGRQRLARRHLQPVVPERLNDQALVGPTGYQGGAGFAAASHRITIIDAEVAAKFIGVGGVALVAMLNQDRTNLGFEELSLITIGRFVGKDALAENAKSNDGSGGQ